MSSWRSGKALLLHARVPWLATSWDHRYFFIFLNSLFIPIGTVSSNPTGASPKNSPLSTAFNSHPQFHPGTSSVSKPGSDVREKFNEFSEFHSCSKLHSRSNLRLNSKLQPNSIYYLLHMFQIKYV